MQKNGRILDLPLLHDHHTHVSLYAAFEGIPNLDGLDASAATSLIASLPRDRLTIVKGWRSASFRFGPEEAREAPPCILVNSSLHGFAFAKAAVPFIRELWPELAERGADPVWGERNLPNLFTFYGEVAGLTAEKLGSYMESLARLGTGSAEDMTVTGEKALAVIRSSPYARRVITWATPEVFERLGAEDRTICAGLKLFLDGSLGARSAVLDAPFLDGKEGLLLYDDETFAKRLASLSYFEKPLSIHAIGHRAIAQAIRNLRLSWEAGIRFPAIRLEHVQFITEEQARECKRLGIVLSVQPNFNFDSRDYADRLCRRHREENDPFRMLIDRAGFVPGEDLLFGSDGMPHGPECAFGQALFPPYASQALSAEELIAGYGTARGIEGRGISLALR